MISTIVKKSYRDLSKRKTRTILTILTIALGVAGISMFAVIPLMDRAVEEEIQETNMYNVQLEVNDVILSQDDMNNIQDISNVESFEPRCIYFTKFYVGERRNDVILIGLNNFNDQNVDIITRNSGTDPGLLQVLTESGNIRNDVFTEGKGNSIRIIDHDGIEVSMEITGEGRCLAYSGLTNMGVAVFYTSLESVQTIGNLSGYNVLSFKFEETSGDDTERTIEDIRDYLVTNTSVIAFAEYPEIREEGNWPGKEILSTIMTIFYSITVVALFCSIFLISNTMHTIISEQKNEIASMKAIGATRAQVFRSYLRTSGLLGLIGASLGAIIGAAITLTFINFLGGTLGVSPGFMVHIPTILVSIIVGLSVTILASFPALLSTLRVTIREAMDSHGIATKFGSSSIDRALKRTGWFPRTVQLGFRNAGRQKRRSISTIIQVSIAVGVMLGMMAFGFSLDKAVSKEYDNWGHDIKVQGLETTGKPFSEDLGSVIEGIDGVNEVEAYIQSGVQYKDVEFIAFGLHYDTITILHEKIIVEGRWFTANDEIERARVFVISEAISKRAGIGYGDVVPLMTATGEYEFTVVGISSSLMYNGMSTFFPFETMRDILKKGDIVTGFYLTTENSTHEEIDVVSTLVEDSLLELGYSAYTEVWYVLERANNMQNQMIANVVYIVGSIVVLITLIGLMSTLTMNILERTKEVGMLRCIGAVAKDIRRIFGSEGMLMVFLGWALGIPVGYLIGRLVWKAFVGVMDVDPPFFYPVINIFLVLVITLLIAIIVIQFPLRRATKLKPGDAIRYQ